MSIGTPDRRDMFRRRRSDTRDNAIDSSAQVRPAINDVDDLKTMVERVASASVNEIERMIAELSSMRDMLRSDGERVQREITGYASMSDATMTSMQIVSDSLAKWKSQTP